MKLLHSVRFSDSLIKVIWITMGWTLVALLKFFSGYVTILDDKFQCTVEDLDFMLYLKSTLIAGLAVGLLGGSLVVFVWEKWLRTKSYAWVLTSIFWSYLIIYLGISLISSMLFHRDLLGKSIFDIQLWQYVIRDMAAVESLESFLFWLSILLGTLIILQVQDKYGPGVFASFLLGKYFHPKKEERIFMFLDLRGSTSIAEKLGEEQYFNFLRSVFRDATPAILKYQGEIYQYVGDEVVVSWPTSRGIKKANCVRCFFEVQQALKDKADQYLKLYGLVPEFKAGLHYGDVMAGEIGIVKREIAYSGDVLNTAARIQAKCNELGVNILLSKYLLDVLPLSVENYLPKLMGDVALRGKEKHLSLYTV